MMWCVSMHVCAGIKQDHLDRFWVSPDGRFIAFASFNGGIILVSAKVFVVPI